MIEIIPAIDLLGGNCVRLLQGNYKEVTEFNQNPIEQALLWQKQGAERLHIVDLDGARTGTPKNDLIILSKLESSKSEIRRLIKGNAIKINNKIIDDEKFIINHKLFNENYIKLSIGKKRHLKIQLN